MARDAGACRKWTPKIGEIVFINARWQRGQPRFPRDGFARVVRKLGKRETYEYEVLTPREGCYCYNSEELMCYTLIGLRAYPMRDGKPSGDGVIVGHVPEELR